MFLKCFLKKHYTDFPAKSADYIFYIFLYICSNIPKAEKLAATNYVFTCEESVIPDSILEISDIYTYFKSEKDKGNFIIKPLEDICLKEISYIHT